MTETLHIIKSDVDYRSYKFLELENGLKVMLVSSLKPGEIPDVFPETDSDSTDEEDGSDIQPEDDITEVDINDCDESASSGLRKSAAALCIHVGSFADPKDAQGLAHFLEHMVFMGSEKYPRENDFDDYVSQRDGSSNACTDSEYTMFYFDIQRCHFQPALDKFANFFCAPLLSQNCVDRELEAVHSEFEQAKANDACRSEHLLTSIAKVSSPYRIFNYGNKKSLKEIPMAAGTNVYNLLRDFQIRYYSANLMTLAVESKDTLENLEKLVRGIFKDVPNRGGKRPNLTQFKDPFDMSTFNKIYKIVPVKETVRMIFTWSLPPMREHYKASPLKFIGAIFGDEGKGSLLSYLREQNLAVELAAGTSNSDNTEFNDMNSLFTISIELAELGRDSYYTVASQVFSYIRMVTASADLCLEKPGGSITGDRSFDSLIPEHQVLCKSSFRFQEPFNPIDTVQTIAQALLTDPPAEVFIADNLLLEPDLKLYADLLHKLTPEHANVSLMLPEFAEEAKKPGNAYRTEPWFGIRYAVEDIPEQQMRIWRDPPINDKFHLPEVNQYIATNFALLPEKDDDEIPVDLNIEDGREEMRKFGNLWHQQRTKFNVPVAYATVYIRCQSPPSTKNKALLKLWSYALDQRLQTLLYSATQAHLYFSVGVIRQGLVLSVNGFSEKLLLLYQAIVDILAAPISGSELGLMLTPDKFACYKDLIRQKTCNIILNPSKFNSLLREYLSYSTSGPVDEFMKALEGCTFKDLMSFVPEMLTMLNVKTFTYGNMSRQEAYPYFDYILQTIKPQVASTDIDFHPPVYPLGCIHHLRVMNFNKSDVNTCLALIAPLMGTPSKDLRLEVLNDLFASCLGEPAFAYLRTLETLGYVVSLYPWMLSGSTRQSGVTLLVCSQATKFDTSKVASRIYAFWFRIIPQIIMAMKQSAFQTAIDAMIATNQLEDATMTVEVRRNKSEIYSTLPIFDRRKRTVDILRSLKLKDLQDFYQSSFYNNQSQPIVMIEVDAQIDTNGDCEVVAMDVDLESRTRCLKTFDWPIVEIQMTDAQLAEETESSLSVNVDKALESCAPGLIDLNRQSRLDQLPPLPKVQSITDLRGFKTAIFPCIV